LENYLANGTGFYLGNIKKESRVFDMLLEGREGEAFTKIIIQDNNLDKLVQLWSDATDHMDKLMHEDFKKNGNAIYTSAIEVGGKGSKASVRQMLEAPMQLRDATNKIVLEPVTRSYSEGLDVAQYWTTLHGARKGTIQKVEGTQEPGRLTKEIVNLNLSTLVTQHDCGTKHGIKLPVEEIDVIERFTSKPIHINGKIIPENTLVTPELIGQMKKHDIKDIEVRSVHKCMSDNGVCSKCVGHNSDGRLHEIGTNVGIIASQALGEPSMQMALDSFHTGGTAMSRGGASASKIDRLDQLLNLPKELAGHAILVHHDGPIQKIEKDPVTNGHNVYVNNEKHFVPQDRYLKVKEGDTLKKGDPLTYGPINPHQLLPLKGIEAVRNYITEEMYNGMYKDERVRRRNVEIVTKNLTNLAQIKEAGNSHYLSGDTAPITEIEKHNRQAKKEEDKIIYKPTIKGAQQAVGFISEDLMDKLNFQRLQGHILQAANTQGNWRLHGLSPIPAIASSTISSKNIPNY
jgi:DNA-directed RNA polymerase subunit beta'